MRAIAGAALAACRRRRLQTAVIAVVAALSAATLLLGLGLLIESDAPFDHAFTRLHGAQATIAYDAGNVTATQIQSTARRPGVTATAGPFTEPVVQFAVTGSQPIPLQPANVAGRADPGGPADTVTLDSGRWVRSTGEIVLSRSYSYPGHGSGIGDRVTAGTPAGQVSLLIVGIAYSVTSSADAWVTPAQAAALAPAGHPAPLQMEYRFQNAGSASQLQADIAGVTAGLPPGAVLGSSTYLQAKTQATESTSALFVPFLVTLSVLGLVMSVLIVINVVSGAVVAGFRTIGIMKAVGFTPGQVSVVYVTQILLPALAGAALGAVAGGRVAQPLLASTARVYDVPAQASIPWWLYPAAISGLAVTAGTAALLPALRAGLIPAVQAISTGRAPRTGHGYQVQRLLGRTRLPAAVSAGLAGPFARPARTVTTVAAVLLGAATVTLGAGLTTSIGMISQGLSRTQAAPVTISFDFIHVGPPAGAHPKHGGRPRPPVQPTGPADPPAVEAALRAQPGTAHFAAETDATATAPGLIQNVQITAYHGDATWTGYPIVTGHWFGRAGQAVASTHLLHSTGKTVGDRLTLDLHGRLASVLITGEIMDTSNGGFDLITSAATLTRWEPHPPISTIEVQLKPGTDPYAYAARLAAIPDLGRHDISVDGGSSGLDKNLLALPGLIGAVTLILAAAAAIGVFNTVALTTAERARDIGILKSVGMTPGQTRTMIITSAAGLGLAGGLAGIPAGVALHHWILPAMASVSDTRLPASFISVYRPPEYTALALAGLLTALLGAIIPADWAARAQVARVLRTE